jgi:hypothetical protein
VTAIGITSGRANVKTKCGAIVVVVVVVVVVVEVGHAH